MALNNGPSWHFYCPGQVGLAEGEREAPVGSQQEVGAATSRGPEPDHKTRRAPVGRAGALWELAGGSGERGLSGAPKSRA